MFIIIFHLTILRLLVFLFLSRISECFFDLKIIQGMKTPLSFYFFSPLIAANMKNVLIDEHKSLFFYNYCIFCPVSNYKGDKKLKVKNKNFNYS